MKKTKKLQTAYTYAIAILAIISVVIAIADMSTHIPYWVSIIDDVIYLIFFFDYFGRFLFSKRKIEFIKSNILDLIAIIPFNSLLRGLRIVKIAKLSKLARLSKFSKMSRLITLLARSSRAFGRTRNFFDTNGFKYVCSIAIFSILIASVAISYVEKMDFLDALWWSFVTTTTVGYGDISPATNVGRIIAAALMIVGIGLIGSLTSTITTFFMNKGKKTVDNSKVDMCMVLFNELNQEEKEIFLNQIK